MFQIHDEDLRVPSDNGTSVQGKIKISLLYFKSNPMNLISEKELIVLQDTVKALLILLMEYQVLKQKCPANNIVSHDISFKESVDIVVLKNIPINKQTNRQDINEQVTLEIQRCMKHSLIYLVLKKLLLVIYRVFVHHFISCNHVYHAYQTRRMSKR